MTDNTPEWVKNFITVADDEFYRFLAWDETQSRCTGSFETYEEAVDCVLAHEPDID